MTYTKIWGDYEVAYVRELETKIERLRAALTELADTAERDLKMNQEDENEGGGWWSLRTENAIRGARRALDEGLPTAEDVRGIMREPKP